MERRFRQMSTMQAAIFGMMISAIYYFLFFDSGDDFKNLLPGVQARVQTAESRIKTATETIADAEKFKQISGQLGDEINSVMRYIPESLSSADLMKMLSTEAKASGVNLIRVTEQSQFSSNATSDQPYTILTVEMELEGSYSQLLLFLSYLTRIDKIVTVSNLKMDKVQSANAQENALKFVGQFNGYRYKGGPK